MYIKIEQLRKYHRSFLNLTSFIVALTAALSFTASAATLDIEADANSSVSNEAIGEANDEVQETGLAQVAQVIGTMPNAEVLPYLDWLDENKWLELAATPPIPLDKTNVKINSPDIQYPPFNHDGMVGEQLFDIYNLLDDSEETFIVAQG